VHRELAGDKVKFYLFTDICQLGIAKDFIYTLVGVGHICDDKN
jgi:hypothetical protein